VCDPKVVYWFRSRTVILLQLNLTKLKLESWNPKFLL